MLQQCECSNDHLQMVTFAATEILTLALTNELSIKFYFHLESDKFHVRFTTRRDNVEIRTNRRQCLSLPRRQFAVRGACSA